MCVPAHSLKLIPHYFLAILQLRGAAVLVSFSFSNSAYLLRVRCGAGEASTCPQHGRCFETGCSRSQSPSRIDPRSHLHLSGACDAWPLIICNLFLDCFLCSLICLGSEGHRRQLFPDRHKKGKLSRCFHEIYDGSATVCTSHICRS